ncbi:hypothetical protein LEN26_020405 [Aphanomyces euteiches]|nr:hypothetical protein LEN26_020405 [Aphanomyces euteiches]KAH9127087.1 hypothetical protein AeMF1_002572 [Aphanomyces euteiches]KAH9184363.1 hypothetical protein AeNC1_013665 [Aphanomyces euteiches]
MPSIFFPLALTFALATETMGSLHLDIVGGDVVPPSSFPNYIAILTNDPPTSGMKCMGSLIAPQFIVTAAHCVKTLAWALLGANYTSGIDAKEQIRITKHFIHPRFDEKTKEFDFAVHQLETPSQQTPVRVDWDDDIFTAPNTKAWIRGYGDTKLDGKRSETLLQTQVTI